MTKLLKPSVSLAILMSIVLVSGGPAVADPNNGHAQPHRHWHKGGHIDHGDWDHAQRIDYHQHHLRPPPPGYEWRQVGGSFVLAAVATGIIASILAANH